MEEVFKMYAMNDGNLDGEPAELDPDHDEEEDEEVETSSILTSSDDDEPVVEETVILIVEEPIAKPAKKKAVKTKAALTLSTLMPLSRDFAFVVEDRVAAGDLVRAVAGADKALIASARVFDVYAGDKLPDGKKSLAIEVVFQPRERTLTDAEIETAAQKVIAAVTKATGATLRG